MKNFFEKFFNKAPSIEDSVSGYFQAIRSWLEKNASSIKKNLNDAASEADISRIESELKIVIPEKVREAYLIHNGEKTDSDGLFGLWRWLSLGEMKVEFHKLQDDSDSNVARIPLLLSPGGDILYVESGSSGEIVEWWHERPSRDVKHSDFQAYLKWFVAKLYEGGYVYLPGEMAGLVDKSEL
ncbi:SMI1/KNR4 family protein [Microbulbifer celer]|uniref:SMI1/KNR4 family protein n=1 Tax=Microbulbifer celer TaxID=435905 RepID=A0ABW3UBZ1_9GAMM|nr:SMI1/KNR4 family protein [Microbulbifer celer]UFN58128.1 SMI1/KNR4 family protein [Microbulbifer celer]